MSKVVKWMNPLDEKLPVEQVRFDKDLAETLRSRPGKWALVAKNFHSATNVYTFGKRYGFDVTVRGSKASGFDIYVRAPQELSAV
jgi:hypothetical protein